MVKINANSKKYMAKPMATNRKKYTKGVIAKLKKYVSMFQQSWGSPDLSLSSHGLILGLFLLQIPPLFGLYFIQHPPLGLFLLQQDPLLGLFLLQQPPFILTR